MRKQLGAVVLTTLLTLAGCNSNEDNLRESGKQNIARTYESIINERIKGFGKIKESKDLAWRGSRLYKTEDGNYVGDFEGVLYLLDKNGELLSCGSKRIEKGRVGKIPKKLLDLKDDYHRRMLFEEDGGIHIRRKD